MTLEMAIKDFLSAVQLIVIFVWTILPHQALAGKCEICKSIATNFEEGIKETTKSNFGGGNTDWEENYLGSYAFSETRFLEILEGVCKTDKDKCHHMVEEHEESIEMWWFREYAEKKPTSLFTYLCIDQIKVCCPPGTFGPTCQDCPNGSDRPCNARGNCKGDGTREGSGRCQCNSGYQGMTCDECADRYFEAERNDTYLQCNACHVSCVTSCTDDTAMSCDACKKGWELTEEDGCHDVDECESDSELCGEGEHCVNTDGSYSCPSCDLACDGCSGAGADHCKLCKPGYTMADDNICTDVDECASEEELCEQGEHCVNTDGSYSCPSCDRACDGCSGAGAHHCKLCKPGYTMADDNICTDLDECSSDPDVCTAEHSRCINTPGSYRCDCQSQYVKVGDKCIPKPTVKAKKKKVPTATLR